jgi:hypothetical protein|tara:strand:- start:295 stop:525 length:231 start_codon:yes stop_codon:yes gene_type:complete
MVYQKPLRTDDLNPDKIKVVVRWDDMVVGASVFIPCIDTEKAKQQMIKIAELKSWKVEMRVRIENKMFGLRIWRTV